MPTTFRLGCELVYEFGQDTVFIFNVEVARLARQTVVAERLTTSPAAPLTAYVDPATGTRYARLLAPAGFLTLNYSAEVDLDIVSADPAAIPETPVGALPISVFPYMLPSRFVPSDRLYSYALREFGGFTGGHERVTAICNWIHDNIEYCPGTSDSETTATESLVSRAGVCRDFAHLGISFCRALGIPARFVTCYANGLVPADFHAVFEAFLDGQWWLFDPTRQAELDGLVRIGVGRDAAEVAFATPFGFIMPGPTRIWIERVGGAPHDAPRTTMAIGYGEPPAEGSG